MLLDPFYGRLAIEAVRLEFIEAEGVGFGVIMGRVDVARAAIGNRALAIADEKLRA